MITRGQIFVRDCGDSRSGYWTKTIGENRRNYALLGILEVPKGAYAEHIVRGFHAHASSSGINFYVNDYQRPLDDTGYACDIGSLALNDIWPRPDPIHGAGGGMVLRDTRMPASNGHQIMLFLAIASLAPRTLSDQTMYEVSGHIGRWPNECFHPASLPGLLSLTNPVMTQIPMGLGLNQIHKLPLWGWDEERVAFTSTMDLVTIDRCQHIDNLRAKATRTSVEQDELNQLLKTDNQHGGIFYSSNNDPLFKRYRQRITEIRGPQKWDRVQTAAEIAQEEVQSEQVLRKLMTEEREAA